MKKTTVQFLVLIMMLLFTTSCSLAKDDLEKATIYTTVYPINYLTKTLFGEYANISSIYPADCDLNTYTLTDRQIKNYAKGDLFIYNGLTNEKQIAKDLLEENKNLLIIDVSYGLTLNNDSTELWLSPNNFLMLAKNIKDNLSEYLTNKFTIEEIENNYHDFEEEISIMDAALHSLGKSANENKRNIIVTSNATFKYLEKYGFEIICLTDSENLKENRLNSIKANFKSGKYKYILSLDTDNTNDNEVISGLINDQGAEIMSVNSLSITLTDNYFDIMTNYLENLKTIVS